MNKKLNWKKGQVKRVAIASIALIMFTGTTFSQNILRIKNKDANNEDFPYLKIGAGGNGVGGNYPCGEEFSIALEDEGRYIFSAASAFNATLTASGDLDYPNDGVGANGKRALKTYSKVYERVKEIKVGYDNNLEKWRLSAETAKELYSSDTFYIKDYEGEERTAINYNNLFMEILMSVQVLAHKNEELTATVESQEQTIATLAERIERLENALKIQNQFIAKKTIGNVSINPNPNTDGNLLVDYQLNDTSKEVQLIMADMNGKIVHQTNLNQTEGNKQLNINLSTGTYLYYLTNHTQQSNAQKLIIQ